jgi:hypothetical protein
LYEVPKFLRNEVEDSMIGVNIGITNMVYSTWFKNDLDISNQNFRIGEDGTAEDVL